MRLSEPAYARLRERQPELADVVDSDRAMDAMRATNVIDLGTVTLRRDRVRAAGARWGHPLRGDSRGPA